MKPELAEIVSEKFTPKQLVTDVNIICADSASEVAVDKVKGRLEIMGEEKAQFLMLHPPYDDIIKFSDRKEDLSAFPGKKCGRLNVYMGEYGKPFKAPLRLTTDGVRA